MADKLTNDFVVELFSAAFNNKNIFDIVLQYLKFSYLQDEPQKRLWQWVTKRYNLTGKIPTMGQIQQNFVEDDKVLELLQDIREVDKDEVGDFDEVVNSFEYFCKKMKFLDANDQITEKYNQGKKEQAWDLFVKYAEDFANFSIHDAQFETVFEGFESRMQRRLSEDWQKRFKVPTGIDELDYKMGGESGGPESGEAVLWVGESGMGKSQVLVHLGITAARHGFRSAHFSLEGTKEQCLNRYDSAWTGTLYQDMKVGNISSNKLDATKMVIKKLRRNDIIVSTEETFNAKTIPAIRKELREMEKKYGKIHVILIDYMELSEPGDGHNYSPGEERFRQSKLAKAMKMLAMEFNAVVHTATQTSNVPDELKKDKDFVISRAYLNEDKGKIRPFDACITMNQTPDERDNGIMRLYTEKLREHKAGDVIYICNDFSHSRFYDRKRTLNMDWEEEEDD